MLKKRVIPTLLWKNIGLVKGEKFDSWRRVGSILPAIKVYNAREVDELILLNVTASIDKNESDYTEISRASKHCFVPLTVGGGIYCIEQVRELLLCGADKVAINSALYSRKELVAEVVNRFGSQCLVGSIDYKIINNKAVCYSHSGTVCEHLDPIEWGVELEKQGVGEIILTSIDRDGCFSGYDIETISKLSNAVSIPVIASGGANSYSDMLQVFQETKSSAVAAASIFHFTEQTPKEAKGFLDAHGIAVRKTV